MQRGADYGQHMQLQDGFQPSRERSDNYLF